MRSRDRLTLATGLAALVMAVFALGGGPRWAVIVIGGLAVVTASTQLRSRRYLTGTSPLLVLVGVATVLTAVQIVPLPDGVLATLNGTSHELIVDGAVLAHGPDHADVWRPLSVDPPATRVELAKLATYFLLAWVALRAAATERGRQRLLSGVAGVAGVVAIVGLIHEMLGAESLFGIYDPVQATPLVMAPLLNANHLACLMVIGAITAAGLAMHERRAPPVRAMWIAVALLCVGVCIATRSRGGVIALGAGATVTAVLVVLQRFRAAANKSRVDAFRVAIPAAVIVLCALVLVVYLGGSVSRELDKTSLDEISDPRSKFSAWGSALTLVEEAPVLGLGRGAFESAFTRVHPMSSQVTFSYPENEYLQVVLDWGFVGVIALGGCLAFALVFARRRWRDGALAAGAIGALVGVAAQSLVDFGLEMPGIAIPVVMIAATLLHVPLEEGSRRRRKWPRYGAVAIAVVALALAAGPWSRTLAEDHLLFRGNVAPDRELALAAFERHPLDYVAIAQVAQLSEPDRRAKLLNHALRLHPTHPALHRVIAGWLADTGRRSQAAIEYRLALHGSETLEPIVAEILRRFPPDEVLTALPQDHRQWARIAKALSDRQRGELALQYLVRVAQARRTDAELWHKVFNTAEALADLATAQLAAKQLAKLDGRLQTPLRLAKLQAKLLKYADALATIEPIAAQDPTSTEHLEARYFVCELHTARRTWEPARNCFNALQALPSPSLAMRRRIHAQMAVIEEALGNKERAAFERKLANEPVTAPSGSASR